MKKTKLLAASAYIFGIPALYIVLTDWHKDSFVGIHGKKALKLWGYFFLIFFGSRFLINFLWSMVYLPHLEKLEIIVGLSMWGYLIFCAFRNLR